MFQTNFVEKIKTHIYVKLLFFLNCAIYEIMLKNVVELGRPQMTLCDVVHIACWVPQATATCSEYVIIIAFPVQHWLHKNALMLLYMYIAYLVCFLQSADLQFFGPLQQTPTKQPLQSNPHGHEKNVLRTQVSILSPTLKFHFFLYLKTEIVNICNETQIF
jgi:hypothetical protein